MAVRKEVLNGGVVQVRHPTLLKEGEVLQADDCILRPGDPALCSAPGRTAYGTVRSTSITTVTVSNTTLTSAGLFGTDIATVTVTSGSDVITKAAAALAGLIAGQTVVGTGIPAGTVVKRTLYNTNDVQLSNAATATGTPTITVSDLHPGTFISGSGITTGTSIASIQSASSLTMSAAASNAVSASRTFSEKVSGLKAIEFNAGESDVMLAKAADKIYTSPITNITGTFTEKIHGLSQNVEATLETVRASSNASTGKKLNGHLILTGFDPPQVIYLTDNGTGTGNQIPTSRALGMKPVTDFVGAVIVPGVWSSLSDLGNRYYYFLITEVFNPGSIDEVESTYSGIPRGVQITDFNTQSILVTYTAGAAPAIPTNDGLNGSNLATHWRIYIAPGEVLDAQPLPDLSAFTAVQDVLMAVNSVTLSNSNPLQSGYARTIEAYGALPALFPSSPSNSLSTIARQEVTATSATSSNILTSSAAFGTVTPGMFITSTTNKIPYGVYVVSVTSSSALVMSSAATGSATEIFGFGNRPSWGVNYATSPPNQGNYRGSVFENFGIENIGAFAAATITGVKVEIKGSFKAASGGDRGFDVVLYKGGQGGTASPAKHGDFGSGAGGGVRVKEHRGSGIITLGGPGDTWGIAWAVGGTDFIDDTSGPYTSFGVALKKSSAAVDITHFIEGVKVTIYSGSETITLNGNPFRTIIITDQIGTSAGVGAAGQPPIASTGDVIDDMVVLNDANSEADIVASLPGNMDAYPAGYRLPLKDKVVSIRRYGTGGIIGCKNSLKRLNYFPRETDADGSKGRCFEDIATDHGVVGPMAITLMDLPGRGSVMPYMSYNGLHWTDAITTSVLNEDLDWGSLVEPTLIHRSVLRVYPKLYLIAFYYVPTGGTRLTKVIYFFYHPTHLKPGFKLPAIGPVSCESGSATSVLVNGVPRLFTGHGLDGKVYLEDNGITDDSGGTILPIIRTRRYYLAELGYDGRVESFYIITDASGTSTTGGFTAVLNRQNGGELVTLVDTVTGDTVTGGIIQLFIDNAGETFDIKISKAVAQSAPIRLHYIGFEAAYLHSGTGD
jgi:hypothetical protein